MAEQIQRTDHDVIVTVSIPWPGDGYNGPAIFQQLLMGGEETQLFLEQIRIRAEQKKSELILYYGEDFFTHYRNVLINPSQALQTGDLLGKVLVETDDNPERVRCFKSLFTTADPLIEVEVKAGGQLVKRDVMKITNGDGDEKQEYRVTNQSVSLIDQMIGEWFDENRSEKQVKSLVKLSKYA